MPLRHLWRGLLRRAAPPSPADPPFAGAVDGHDVLARLVRLPVSTWRYDWEPPGVRHLGPMAQDWKAAFDFGQSDKSIPVVDANGVAFVSIQALHRLIVDLQTQIDELRAAQEAGPSAPGPRNPAGEPRTVREPAVLSEPPPAEEARPGDTRRPPRRAAPDVPHGTTKDEGAGMALIAVLIARCGVRSISGRGDGGICWI